MCDSQQSILHAGPVLHTSAYMSITLTRVPSEVTVSSISREGSEVQTHNNNREHGAGG